MKQLVRTLAPCTVCVFEKNYCIRIPSQILGTKLPELRTLQERRPLVSRKKLFLLLPPPQPRASFRARGHKMNRKKLRKLW